MRKPSRISLELENLVECYTDLISKRLKEENVKSGCLYSGFYGGVYGHTFYNFAISTYPIVDGLHKDEEVLSKISLTLDGKKMSITDCSMSQPYARIMAETVPELRKRLEKTDYKYKRSLNALISEIEIKSKFCISSLNSDRQAHSDVLLKLAEKKQEREFRKNWR